MLSNVAATNYKQLLSAPNVASMTKELHMQFYVISTNLNSHNCLVATIMNGTDLETGSKYKTGVKLFKAEALSYFLFPFPLQT